MCVALCYSRNDGIVCPVFVCLGIACTVCAYKADVQFTSRGEKVQYTDRSEYMYIVYGCV